MRTWPAIKRNASRFRVDFAFQLTAEELVNLKSHSVTSSLISTKDQRDIENRSQNVTGSHGGRRKRPTVFTEHGTLMAANVLRSRTAERMSVFVIRAFIRLREHAVANAVILKRLAEIDKTLLQHDAALRDVYRKLQTLLSLPPDAPKRRIGF